MTSELKKWILKVKVAMLHENMNQAELAALIGVTPPVISDLFRYGKASEKVKNKINVVLNIK